MTIEEILKKMSEGWDLSMYPSGIQLVKEGCFIERLSNSKFYELIRDGFISFSSLQGHFDVDVIKLSLTPKGRDLVDAPLYLLICNNCGSAHDGTKSKEGARCNFTASPADNHPCAGTVYKHDKKGRNDA